ncbi:MAG: heavy-metal-associated domain-containing protein [Bacteroidetes bacterium]|nr:heavy-metal-associated domain-containing protein [Bacteroidota bacterium]
MKTQLVKIDGMTCGHCAMAVKKELSKIPGVNVKSVEIGKADIEVDELKVSASVIENAVKEAGYTVTSIQ